MRSPLHALERGSIGLLVATSIVEPVIGLINSAQWYPFGFPFVETHYLLAWLLVGLLAVHVAIKLPTIVRHWRRWRYEAPCTPCRYSRPTGPPQSRRESTHDALERGPTGRRHHLHYVR